LLAPDPHWKIEGAGPAQLLQLIRGHWAIENRLHYVRDVSFGEDGSQIRSGAAPQVLAALRNAVIGLLKEVCVIGCYRRRPGLCDTGA
jgi:predicted transposase YbfD/YdcC